MIGTIANTATILAGSLVGSRLKSGLGERYKEALMNGMGLGFLPGLHPGGEVRDAGIAYDPDSPSDLSPEARKVWMLLDGRELSFDRLAEEEPVAEITQQRVGEYIDEQPAERAGRHQRHICAARAVFAALQMHQPVGGSAADHTDDKLEHERRAGVAGVAGDDIGQRQADGPRQPARDAVEQQRRQRCERVAQVERRPARKRDAEKLIRHQAERRHNADHADFLHGETGLGQHRRQQRQRRRSRQQQP